MKLRDLLAKIPDLLAIESDRALNSEVTGISTNSHACKTGDIFIGMPGSRVDGGEFWKSAIDNGAIAAIVSQEAAKKYPPSTTDCILTAKDPIAVCAELSAAFYDYPAQKLNMVGITGTNGKTTTSYLIEYFLNRSQLATALFGTLFARWPGFSQTANHTTPFAAQLQSQLADAVKASSKYAVIEVSSHALAQNRVKGCSFEVAVFTNLTQDHLDFHKDMEDYFAAKAKLFSDEYLQGRAIINLDDPYGMRLIENTDLTKVWTYSVDNTDADLYTSNLTYEASGVSGTLHTPRGESKFRSPLVGQYNISNLLAAVGAVLHLNLDLKTIVESLSQFSGVPGRMERVEIDEEQDISVIVDYAHTPDSLENLLIAAKPFISQQTICVFGCGGDRDRTKRPLMGQAVAKLADVVVVTSDNPRTEDPQRILDDILEGIPETVKPIVEIDRAAAINKAIQSARSGDGVIIAGKGHEDYQILGTEKIHFDDREVARDALGKRLSQ
ncbi:MAG: UDP-N-acetylmuramoyl-L-alanyl-D-glutamate--2,6-diaminopimelate ligase [Prochloraceae cyanobacterium]